MRFVLLFLILPFTVMSDPPILGGFSDRNPSDYTETAWKSVPQINEKLNGPNYLVPVKVLKAQVQVVAGTKTVLEVLFAESTCSKSLEAEKVTSSNCQLKNGGQRFIYEVSIWEKLWENFEQIDAKKIRDVSAGEQF